jgi:phosphatidylinositol glycan class T
MRARLWLLLGLLGGTVAATLSDHFNEHLTLRPLADGRLHTLFSFALQSSDDYSTSVPIYSTVPRSLIHLAKASDAEEIHLAINAGRWDYQKWGEPGAEEMVGNGAEVWAKLRRHEATPHRHWSPK